MKKVISDQVNFDERGLVPVIVVDEKAVVLMLAYMNAEALELTLKTGMMHYFSRSRKKIWLKGESSGHYQYWKKLYLDCDGDCLLATVEQKGAACHEGYYSCFFRFLRGGRFVTCKRKVFDPKKVYQ